MMILIYGEDSFRVTEKIKQMKKAFSEKFDHSGLNIHTFPHEGTSKLDAPEILQSICSFPFLSKKRMVVIAGLLSTITKADQEVWMEGFLRMPESTIVVLWETGGVEKKPLFKEIEKMTDVHKYSFPELQGAALTKWVVDRIQACGGKIEPNGLQALVERVGSDLWQLSCEINKLIGYVGGGVITKEIVIELVHASFEGKIFELMDAISKKHMKHAVRLLEQERSSGSDDHYLLTMLGRQIRLLLGARAMMDENPRTQKQDVATSLDVHPFVASKVLDQARLFRFEDLASAHDLLFEFDQKIKTGRINADLSIDLIVESLTSS